MKLTKTQRKLRDLWYWAKDNESFLWLVGYSVFVYVVMVSR